MSTRNVMAFGIAGVIAWGLASLFYAAFGAGLLEASFWFYCLNAFGAATVFACIFQLVARLSRQPRHRRVAPAAVFTIPGVTGAATLMCNYDAFPPGADPASLGRYGAFLLVAYLAVGTTALDKSAKTVRRPEAAAPVR